MSALSNKFRLRELAISISRGMQDRPDDLSPTDAVTIDGLIDLVSEHDRAHVALIQRRPDTLDDLFASCDGGPGSVSRIQSVSGGLRVQFRGGWLWYTLPGWAADPGLGTSDARIVLVS